jgi:hypothetical protein
VKPENPDASIVSVVQGSIRISKISTVRMVRSVFRPRGIGNPIGQNGVIVVCDGAAIETDTASYVQSPLRNSFPPPFVELVAAIAPGRSGNDRPELYTGVDPLTQKNQWFLAYFGSFRVADGGFGAYEWQPDLGGLAAYCNGSGGLPGPADAAQPVALPPSVGAIDLGTLTSLMNKAEAAAVLTGHVEVALGLLITEGGSKTAGISFCKNENIIPTSSVPEVSSFPFRGFRPSYAMFTAEIDQRVQMEMALRSSCL